MNNMRKVSVGVVRSFMHPFFQMTYKQCFQVVSRAFFADPYFLRRHFVSDDDLFSHHMCALRLCPRNKQANGNCEACLPDRRTCREQYVTSHTRA